MGARQKEHGRKVWLWTIEYLGGVCNRCGSAHDLTIDHKDPLDKTVKSSAKGSDSRAYEYRKLALAGKAQVLCRSCNAKKGRLTDSDIEELVQNSKGCYARSNMVQYGSS